jgi:FtsZ-binding cell division protein ZapB
VSNWLAYAPGIRDAIAHARDHPSPQTTLSTRAATEAASPEATDLALARAEVRRLRTERDQQQHRLRLALGARLDDLAKAERVTRIGALTRENTALTQQLRELQHHNNALTTQVSELEDDLAAARTSLRRMIRADNRPQGDLPPG